MTVLRSILRQRTLMVAVAVVLALSGCAKKSVQAPPATPPAPPVETAPAPAPAEKPSETPAPAPTHTFSASDLQPVFFDFDSYTLRDDGRATLDSDAKLLRDHADAKVMIEGHCDERGTAEYNQALGERRATAAKDYLVRAGIPDASIQIISYGKERPFDPGHDEAAWAKNRRAHFALQ